MPLSGKIFILATELTFVFIIAVIATASSLPLKERMKQLNANEQENVKKEARFYALANFALGTIVTTMVATILYFVLEA